MYHDTKPASHDQHSDDYVSWKEKIGVRQEMVLPHPWVFTVDIQNIVSIVDFLWEGAVDGVEPALPLGLYAVDDAVEAVCGHHVAKQDEL